MVPLAEVFVRLQIPHQRRRGFLHEKHVAASVRRRREDVERSSSLVLVERLYHLSLDAVPLPGREFVDEVHENAVERRHARRLQGDGDGLLRRRHGGVLARLNRVKQVTHVARRSVSTNLGAQRRGLGVEHEPSPLLPPRPHGGHVLCVAVDHRGRYSTPSAALIVFVTRSGIEHSPSRRSPCP